jgi:hypothetical protein
MDPARWAALTVLAREVSDLSGRSVTPGQMAGYLLAASIDRLREDDLEGL